MIESTYFQHTQPHLARSALRLSVQQKLETLQRKLNQTTDPSERDRLNTQLDKLSYWLNGFEQPATPTSTTTNVSNLDT